ncbi:MAG: MurR/RpiR family transcriptional regulator [Desulfobacterales bacterium]|nr:MurR/RpiR family transcriptional regulator [Desulfobacterales bacterium]
MEKETNTLQEVIDRGYDSLAAKGRLLATYVLSNPDKAVFMTTRQLAAAVGTSEATVIRFVRQLGFKSYALFISALRDLIDRKLTLIERGNIRPPVKSGDDEELLRLVHQDVDDISAMQKGVDLGVAKEVRELLKTASQVYVIGARLSFSSAHYLGWTLSKIRSNVTILNGSDSTAMDRMVFAPGGSLVVLIATSRYPNELIRLGKIARRQNMKQVLITDSTACPLAQFSDRVLVAPQQSIPFLGNPVSIISLIHYLLHTLASGMGDGLKAHQEQLEKAYMENDTWFN